MSTDPLFCEDPSPDRGERSSQKQKPAKVVVLGGGHGASVSLRAACRYAARVTAVISTADDGGSSGRLRAALGVPPPGDLRRCLAALAAEASPWANALEHRFSAGELDGHALGNILIAGLTEAGGGDLVAALDEVARITGVDTTTHRVLPATTHPVVLKADAGENGSLTGQVAIEAAGSIRRVGLVPPDAAAPDDAVEAIEQADQVVLGPGSLYTSVLAAAIVPAIQAALDRTRATRVYVCNLRAVHPETAGYTAADHVAALLEHDVPVDVALCHPGALPTGDLGALGVRVVEVAVAGPEPHSQAHDPGQLAAALADLVG